MAIGLQIHWGDTGIMNLAHASFFGLGAYTSVILTTPPREGAVFNRVIGFDFPVLVGLVGAAVVAGLSGVLIATTSLRVEDDYLAVVSLGIAEIMNLIVGNEEWLTGGVQGISSVKDLFSTSLALPYDYVYFGVMLVALTATYLVFSRLSRSPFGRVLRAIREDENVPEALGKRTTLYKFKSFGIGAAAAGFAGGLWAHFANTISTQLMSPNLTFLILTAIILGGVGSYLGAVFGTVLLMSLFQSVQYLPEGIPLGDSLTYLRVIVIGVVLILVMYYRPYGLLGDQERMQAGHSGGGD
jgi:branched-chain amino acid transport system permease protein